MELGMILKPNMVLPGLTCPRQESVDEVADATEKRAVPITVLPGHSGVPCSFFSFADHTSSG